MRIDYAHSSDGVRTMNASRKRAANLTLDPELLEEARALGVNLSRAAENGVHEAVTKARAERWRSENAGALRSSNEYVDEHGLPLERFRSF